jgi:hypothetical protein
VENYDREVPEETIKKIEEDKINQEPTNDNDLDIEWEYEDNVNKQKKKSKIDQVNSRLGRKKKLFYGLMKRYLINWKSILFLNI